MKRSILILLVSLFYLTASAQQSFIKSIDDLNAGSRVKVLPTSDKGWVLFSLDSLKMYKFNSCGDIQWAKKYVLPAISSCAGNDIISTMSGGFILLNRVKLNLNINSTLLTTIDASGNIIWSILYEDPLFSHCPYTIAQDNTGDFILYGNASPLGGGSTFNMISKIKRNGIVLWTKYYSHGGTWGGAIVTSDNGVLVRAGDLFMKTDDSGNVEWASHFSSPGTYYYIKPIEVEDGYIFNKYNQLTNNISFYKMDKMGNLLWNGRKTINYIGIPPELRKKSNGNFAAVFNKTIAGKNYPVVMEFDKDLNVVQQGVINYAQSSTEFYAGDFDFLNTNAPILAGWVTVNTNSYLFFAKMNDQYQTSCDTSLAVNIVIENVTQIFENTNVTTHNLGGVSKNYVVNSFSVSTTTLCIDTAPQNLNIGLDTLLCPDSTLTLKNNTSDLFDNYLWSTGDTTASITITQPGTYWLRASNSCRSDSLTDSVTVGAINFPDPSLVHDTSLCSNDPVILDATIADGTYLWQDETTNNTFYAFEPGEYYVDITYQTCMKRFNSIISECEILNIPNVFTPNNDDINDLFKIEYYGLKDYHLLIYSRWGLLMFESNDNNYHWDGKTIKNKDASEGTYYFVLTIGQKPYTGYLSLLR